MTEIMKGLTRADLDTFLHALDKSVLASLTDARGSIIYANEKFADVSKYSLDELIGQNHRILKSGLQPQEMFITMWKTISSGRVWRGEIQNRARDGSYYWVDTTIAPILGSDGKPERYVSIRVLITEQKAAEETLRAQNLELQQTKTAMLSVLEDIEEEKTRAEKLSSDLEKFKLAVDSANDQVIITDENATLLYANAAMEKITGYTISEALGKKAGSRDLWGGLMSKEFYQTMWKTIKEDKRAFAGEIRNRRKNGEEYYAKGNISPVLGENGEVEFFVAIEHDSTEEQRIDRAKTEFVSLASHQLRTPLSSINWYSEMLLGGDAGALNEEQKKYLDAVYAGSRRMVALVDALLNVSRLELGTFTSEPKPTDIAALARSVLAEQQPDIDARRMVVEANIADDIPQVSTDAKFVRMVFQNLLSNAVKYTPEGGHIMYALARDGDAVAFTVADSGWGVPLDQQDKIFTKLFRADNVRAHDTQGTGLGLYIVKSIVDNLGGAISFESEENKGTTFHVHLPLSSTGRSEKTLLLGSP